MNLIARVMLWLGGMAAALTCVPVSMVALDHAPGFERTVCIALAVLLAGMAMLLGTATKFLK